MNDFTFYLCTGLCVGARYALIALGYTMVYGIIKLINFAHGEFYMVAAYAGFGAYCLFPAETPLWVLIPVIMLVSGAAGAGIAGLTEWIAYKPIRHSGRLAALLTAIGVSFLLQSLFALINDANPLQYPNANPGDLGRVCQTAFQGLKVVEILYIPVTLILTFLLWIIVQRTDFGRAMRAVSQDATAAVLMGINIDSVIRKTFLIGGFMAGIAGAMMGFQCVIEPMMGFAPGLKAFIAAVVGGIGSIPGAVLGGFLIGVIENMVVYLGVPTGYKDIASFLILILVLCARPQGILGKTHREKV